MLDPRYSSAEHQIKKEETEIAIPVSSFLI